MIQTTVWNGGVDFAPIGGKKRRNLNSKHITVSVFGVVGCLKTCIAAEGMEEARSGLGRQRAPEPEYSYL